MKLPRAAFCLFGLLWLAGCQSRPKDNSPAASVHREAEPPGAAPADYRPVIVAFGDSLTAGFGVDVGLSYPDFLQKELDARGYRYRVVNEGLSGDTTSGGAARTGRVVALRPAIVILELGGNDGLRGLPLAITRSNLELMIEEFRRAGAAVVLAGMTLPRNYGGEYIGQFEVIYRDLAAKHKLRLIPFLLEGVALVPGLMQQDGIHPTVEGNRKVAETVFRALQPLLKR